jgi:hypothetical protein
MGGSTKRAMVGPHSDLWLVSDAHFYNFPEGTGAISQCMSCESNKDNAARTQNFEKLHFDDASVVKRVFYKEPDKGINLDLDGTLTGLGPNSWTTSRWGHNEQDECTINEERYDGIICPSSVTVRRVMFFSPKGGIKGKKMFIW